MVGFDVVIGFTVVGVAFVVVTGGRYFDSGAFGL